MNHENRGIELANAKGLPEVLTLLSDAATWWDTIDDFFAQIAKGTPNKVDDFVVQFIGMILPPAAETAEQIKVISDAIKAAKTPEEKAVLVQQALDSIGDATKSIQVFFLALLFKSINA